jgi:hypothetical protein
MEQKELKEREVRFTNRDLSEIEHLILGSTTERYDTKEGNSVLEDVEKIARGDPEITKIFLTPISIAQGRDIHETNIARKGKVDYLPSLRLFGAKAYLSLYNAGFTSNFELPDIDEKTGTIIPQWRIKNHGMKLEIKPSDAINKLFEVMPAEEMPDELKEEYLIIRLKNPNK